MICNTNVTPLIYYVLIEAGSRIDAGSLQIQVRCQSNLYCRSWSLLSDVLRYSLPHDTNTANKTADSNKN